jgi:catechol 2,3-dioxygenase-like lactoylglutathione lyase family enzyme
MSDPAPTTRPSADRRATPRSVLLAIPLLLCLGPHAGFGGNDSDRSPPLPLSGLAGVTFLTADLASVQRFYGKGAGFAEAPAGPGSTRFIVGAHQWIEFQAVQTSNWLRRLQHVTLEAPSLERLDRALRARGVTAKSVGPEKGRVLQFEDPAGNLIQASEQWTPPSIPPRKRSSFSEHLQHFGLAVSRSKAESTMAFYRDTLGWPEVARGLGADGRLAMIKFRLPGTRNELVELILFDPPLNKWAAGAFDHVNFEVSNIDDAYRALRREGIATQNKHRPTVNGERLWAIDIIDPELTRMEVQVLAPTREAIGTVSRLTIGTLP